MHKEDNQFFADSSEQEAPTCLLENIMRRIRVEKYVLKLKRRVVIFSICFAGMAVAYVPVFRIIEKNFVDSGFWEFLSLIFLHFSIIAMYWQSYLFALLESLPVMSMVAFLAYVLIFLVSLKAILRDTRMIRASRGMAYP